MPFKKLHNFLAKSRNAFTILSLLATCILLAQSETVVFVQAGASPWVVLAVTVLFTIANVVFFDLIFMGWAKLRFDMYVISGVVSKTGNKYERGTFVRAENEEYFIPLGQELVLRNSQQGNAQVVNGPATGPKS